MKFFRDCSGDIRSEKIVAVDIGAVATRSTIRSIIRKWRIVVFVVLVEEVVRNGRV